MAGGGGGGGTFEFLVSLVLLDFYVELVLFPEVLFVVIGDVVVVVVVVVGGFLCLLFLSTCLLSAIATYTILTKAMMVINLKVLIFICVRKYKDIKAKSIYNF